MRLLMIEDDAEIAALLVRYLQKQGFDVVHVTDGEQGVRAFAAAATSPKGPFSVVLTDGLLPKKNGYEVAAAIRKLPGGNKVGLVMMTAAFRGARSRSEAYGAGFDAFFPKPFVLTELRDELVALATRGRGRPQDRTGAAAVGAPPPVPAPPAPSSSARSSPTPSPAPPRQERARLSAEVRVDGVETVARLLLLAARERLDGVLRFVDGDSVLQVAFLRGIAVGATDNLREHALGEWLHRQGRLTDEQVRALERRLAETNERIAEALIALGFVTASEALTLLELQAVARVRRALLWQGRALVVRDAEIAAGLAVDAIDLVEVLITFGLEAAQADDARRFCVAHAREPLERAPDFDAGLVAFARHRPSSTLPQALLSRPLTVAEAAAVAVDETFALWLAGLVRTPADPPFDARPVPRAMKSQRGALGLVDEDIVSRISALLLRARGGSVYRLLDVPPSTSSEEILAGLARLNAEVGREALAHAPLGPIAGAARELWTLLEEAIFVFSDERRRATYDADLAAARESRGARAPTSALLEAQQRLAAGEPRSAYEVLLPYAEANPEDVEAAALRGYLLALCGDRDGGNALLVEAARRHPQAVRPLFFLGMLALADGDRARAKRLLLECRRRFPGDNEVERALSLVED